MSVGSSLRDAIITEALTWDKVPYIHGQHSRHGCDCVGLLIGVAKAVTLLPETYQPCIYTSDWHCHNSTELLKQGIEALGGLPIALQDIQPGDILLFRYAHAASHAGILLPGPRLIHAKRQARRVICHSFTPAAHPELDCAYAFPGVQ